MLNWTAEDRQKLRDEVPAKGLEATIDGRSVRDIAQDCLKLARAALLERRNVGCKGRTEAHFLDVLDEVVDSGETSADQLLKLYISSWDGDINRVFRDFAF